MPVNNKKRKPIRLLRRSLFMSRICVLFLTVTAPGLLCDLTQVMKNAPLVNRQS